MEKIEMLTKVEHVRKRPGMYCPFYQYSNAIFEMALRYFADSHIAGCSNRLDIEYRGNTVRFRDWGKPIPFEKMKPEADFMRWNNFGDFHGMSGWNPEVTTILMGLCKEMELTSFCAGRKLTCFTADDARCGVKIHRGNESRTDEADGVEMKLTHEKDFDPAYIKALTSQFHALFPDFEISVNGCKLPKSNGLIDLLYLQLDPMQSLEPIFSFRSHDLDLTAALQVHPRKEGGPFISPFLNCYAISNGRKFKHAVLDALKNIERPFDIENLCVIFHCKVRTWDIHFGGMGTPFIVSTATRKEFIEQIEITLKNGIRQYTKIKC